MLFMLLGCGTLALLGCGTEPASRARPASAEWVRPFDGYLPECAPEGVAVLRVVDGRTHQPIEGAIVRKHHEIDVGPDGWAPVAQEARTDAYGLAWFEPDDRGGHDAHWSVRAAGYATTQEYGHSPQDTVELLPPRTRHGRIVDALGRPIVGMPIGYKEGCGHSPFLAETKTDEDGRFVISGVGCDGEVFFAARGVLGDYFRGPLRPLQETPYTHVASPAIRVRGRIAGAKPHELGARVVHALAEQRGPFGRIGDDGRFVIDGLDRDGYLTLWSDARGETRELSLNDFRPGGPFVWDLRLSRDDDPTDSDTIAKRRLRVLVVDPNGQPAHNISVTAFGAADGRMHDHADDSPEEDDEEPVKPPGEVALELLPGSYDLELSVDGGRWHADPRRVAIGKEPPMPLTIHARAWPRLEVVWPGKDASVETWSVAYADPDGFINMEELRENGLHLPPHALARAAVPAEDRIWFFDVAPAVDGVRKAIVTLPAPQRVICRSAHEPEWVYIGGDPVDMTRVGDGRYELETHLEGTFEFEMAYTSDRRGEIKHWARQRITLGAEKIVDLGEIKWVTRPRGTLTLLDAAGRPVPDQQVELAALDTRSLASSYEHNELTTDDNGQVSSPLLRAGAWLAVTSTEPKIYRHLEGSGPWTVRLGDATIELEVHGRYGILTTAHLMVDGERFSRVGDDEYDRRTARYEVKTLSEGPHVLLITAPGHRGEAHRVVLKAGETRRIRVDLPERD